MAASCDTCRKPGSCCSRFVLNHANGDLLFRVSDWQREAQAFVESRGFPFVAVSRIEHKPSNEPDMTSVLFDCRNLGADGRCTSYSDRPKLCRVYEPGADALCAEFVQTLKGIPIVVA